MQDYRVAFSKAPDLFAVFSVTLSPALSLAGRRTIPRKSAAATLEEVRKSNLGRSFAAAVATSTTKRGIVRSSCMILVQWVTISIKRRNIFTSRWPFSINEEVRSHLDAPVKRCCRGVRVVSPYINHWWQFIGDTIICVGKESSQVINPTLLQLPSALIL